MKSKSSYRKEAKELMEGKYTEFIVTILVFAVILGVLGYFYLKFSPEYDYVTLQVIEAGQPMLANLMNIITILVSAALAYTMYFITIKIVNKQQIDISESCLAGFKNDYPRNLGLSLLISIFVALWTLLLIIPGIIKAYSYSMSFYLRIKKPNLTASDAIFNSKTLTDGYKMDLFLLDLSYLGWYFLSIFTLGILTFWIVPKHQTARTLMFEYIYENGFYKETKKETVYLVD